MILVSFPRANSNVRALIQGLHGYNLLHSFHTTLDFESSDLLTKLAPPSIQRALLKRSFDVPKALIHQYPWLELVRLAARKFRLHGLTDSYESVASIDRTCISLDHSVARFLQEPGPRTQGIKAVYCYEDSAVRTFQQAKDLGKPRFYELTFPYWRAVHGILQAEADRLPDWACTIGAFNDPPEKLETKTAEIELADVIFCISNFVRSTLPSALCAGKRVVVVPYGAPDLKLHGARRYSATGQKLRILFVGGMSQRKGLGDLFTAMKLLNRSDLELVVAGANLAPLEFYRQQLPNFTYVPPCSHPEILELMQTCDVFAFPSLLEGRGLVQLEALSCGLPLITTINATGDDLVDEGKNGFIVPIRDPQAISEKIAWFADNRDMLPDMGVHARQKALAWSWKNYIATVLENVRDYL